MAVSYNSDGVETIGHGIEDGAIAGAFKLSPAL